MQQFGSPRSYALGKGEGCYRKMCDSLSLIIFSLSLALWGMRFYALGEGSLKVACTLQQSPWTTETKPNFKFFEFASMLLWSYALCLGHFQLFACFFRALQDGPGDPRAPHCHRGLSFFPLLYTPTHVEFAAMAAAGL